MRVVESVGELRRVRHELRSPVGFVPTMGFLHGGHLALVHRARSEQTTVVASIFVNPTQFAPHEDLASYPRDLQRDLELLEQAGADVAWTPSVEDMYLPDHDTWVVVDRLTHRLEGASRPTHFRGVATIVAKLFHLVQPAVAYFGQKDAQQALVVDRLVRDLHLPISLCVVPTVREADGLAMSSRNTYLSPAERAAAPVLRRSLDAAERQWQGGERSAEALRAAMREVLASEPAAEVEYVSVADVRTLEELDRVGEKALVSLAVRLGHTRLIDNTLLPPGTPLLER
ncbi:MAG: pantoate--beta-alanine ligase [Candidatus Bipolaricaulota bacterium]